MLEYTDLYASDGLNHNLLNPGSTTLEVAPGFLAYDADGLPTDLHLAADSPLIDAGDRALPDPDGTRSDLGCYGGDYGDDWDLDGEGLPDYFWPGGLEAAPAGYDVSDCDASDYDPDALDPDSTQRTRL